MSAFEYFQFNSIAMALSYGGNIVGTWLVGSGWDLDGTMRILWYYIVK